MIKKSLWGIIFVVMLISIPFLWERISVEEANDQYEVTVPFQDIDAMVRDTGLDEGQVYSSLTEGEGIQSVAVEPLTLGDLRQMDLIEYVSTGQLIQLYDVEREDVPQETGIYLELIEPEHRLVEPIEEVLNYGREEYGIEVERMEIEGDEFLYVPFGSGRTLNEPITFDLDAIEEIRSYDLGIVPRLADNFYTEEENHVLFEQLEEFSSDADYMLFEGVEVVGVGEPDITEAVAERFNSLDLGIVMIEAGEQAGFGTLNEKLDRETVRLHSMTLGKAFDPTEYTEVYRGARAVQERNIQMLYVNILNHAAGEFYYSPQEALDSLETTQSFLDDLHRRTAGEPGQAEPYETFSSPLWFELLVLLAAAAFTGLAACWAHRKLALPAAGAALVIFWAVAVLQIDMLMKGIVLALAVIAPAYAILSLQQPAGRKMAFVSYLKGAGIALTGAWFVITLLYGSDYVMHLDMFRGVKILSVAPLLITAVIFVGYRWLKEPVKFWHLVVLGGAGGLALFYVSRTGNAGTALPFELEARQALENLFGVRPRTTEFLIGLPVFLLGLYMWADKIKYSWFLLLGGALAFSSMVGTFTHLHTPLLVSLTRTGLSLVLGAIIGLVLIGLYELAKRFIYPAVKERFLP
ncbi:DUF5693 family protein [Alkalicoccus urumqiensis]|uniref:Uncharacterized protein n=1 Tax=Alkalicoccus urumqiensis TaxID=1548213 RepID=A0A2P6MHC8_ALKUR|nr:DUF5693 family protein [Alkalicoccus urumqiensis]PRO65684.1 hypothetical protein C6I21_09180 [Alkalicoccus urumqiensis]